MSTAVFQSSENLEIQYYNGSTWVAATLPTKRSELARSNELSLKIDTAMANKVWVDSGGIYTLFAITFYCNNSADYSAIETFINLLQSRGTYESSGNDYFKIYPQGTGGTLFSCYPNKYSDDLHEGFGSVTIGFATKDKRTTL